MKTTSYLLTIATALIVHIAESQPSVTVHETTAGLYAERFAPELPDPAITPGAVMPGVTVKQITQKGYANVLHGGVRNVPESEKRAVFIEYFGEMPPDPGDFEVDHLISLELGGSNDRSNLWPEYYGTNKNGLITVTNTGHTIKLLWAADPTWNAHVKDRLEDWMAARVRADLKQFGSEHAERLLHEYQVEISTNWIVAYTKYLGPR
jgi:hypothetical protein